MINNKLKNCCNDCVYCEIVTETKRRAIPENKTEVVLVNIKCSHMCVCSRYQKEVQDGSICCAECMYLLGSDTKNYYMCNVGKYDRIDNAYLCTCDKYKNRNPSTKEYKR